MFKKPFGQHHKKYIANVAKIILNDGKQAIAMPRGSGKSAVEKGTVPWAFVYGHRRSVVIVTATLDDAREFIDDIKTMLTSAQFVGDFPEIGYPLKRLNGTGHLTRGQTYLGEPTAIQWESLRLKLPNIPGSTAAGSVVRAAGINGKIRGKSSAKKDGEILRPDFVILDDLQTAEDAINPNRVHKIEIKVGSDVAGLAADGEDLAQIMSCTVIAPGDAADRFLDREIYADWNGLRYAMIEKFPDRMDLWEGEYARLFRIDPELAREFYRSHRVEMDAGAVVDWEENFNPKHEDSRLQRGMNLLLTNPMSFWSERQNRPLTATKTALVVDAKEIRRRLNGLERRQVPMDTLHVTAFIDCHDDLLYWMVAAWNADFTGSVIDYGVWPEQSRRYFNRGDQSLVTLNSGIDTKGKSKDAVRKLKNAAIQHGLETLLRLLIGESYDMQGDGDGSEIVKIERIFVDSAYVHRAVEAAITRIDGWPIVWPSLGVPVTAKETPMEHWRSNDKKTKVGYHWINEKIQKRVYRTLKMDVNYWKTACHDALSLVSGTQGGITFWGLNPETHKMVSEHLTAESVQIVEAKYKVHEWRSKPGTENHFFDCLVGNMVAASTLGIISPEEREAMESMRRMPGKVTDL